MGRMFMLHLFRINGVILPVGSNELHKASLALVINCDNQAIFVSRYVEDNPTAFKDAGRPKLRFHFLRGSPRGFRGFCVPGFYGALSVRVPRTALPELPKGSLRDNAH